MVVLVGLLVRTWFAYNRRGLTLDNDAIDIGVELESNPSTRTSTLEAHQGKSDKSPVGYKVVIPEDDSTKMDAYSNTSL